MQRELCARVKLEVRKADQYSTSEDQETALHPARHGVKQEQKWFLKTDYIEAYWKAGQVFKISTQEGAPHRSGGGVPGNTWQSHAVDKMTLRSEGLGIGIRGRLCSYCKGWEGRLDFHR